MSKIAIFIVYADSSFAESLLVKSIDITKITANTTTSISIIEFTVGKHLNANNSGESAN